MKKHARVRKSDRISRDCPRRSLLRPVRVAGAIVSTVQYSLTRLAPRAARRAAARPHQVPYSAWRGPQRKEGFGQGSRAARRDAIMLPYVLYHVPAWAVTCCLPLDAPLDACERQQGTGEESPWDCPSTYLASRSDVRKQAPCMASGNSLNPVLSQAEGGQKRLEPSDPSRAAS